MFPSVIRASSPSKRSSLRIFTLEFTWYRGLKKPTRSWGASAEGELGPRRDHYTKYRALVRTPRGTFTLTPEQFYWTVQRKSHSLQWSRPKAILEVSSGSHFPPFWEACFAVCTLQTTGTKHVGWERPAAPIKLARDVGTEQGNKEHTLPSGAPASGLPFLGCPCSVTSSPFLVSVLTPAESWSGERREGRTFWFLYSYILKNARPFP